MASLARTKMLTPRFVFALPKRHLPTSAAFLRSSRPISILSNSHPFRTSPYISRIAAFHSSAQLKILPPGPQVLEGGINDAAPVPKPSPTHGSYHWTFERLIAVGLIPLTITPFASGSLNPTLDAIFVAAIIVHSHIGFQSCITDYFSTLKHPKLRKFFDWLLNIATIVVAIGFYEFETNDVGITEALKRIWHAGRNDATVEAANISRLGHDGKLGNLSS